MENIIFSANIVLPLLILMALGYMSKSQKMMDTNTVSQCNSLVFKLFLPMLLFSNVRASSLEELGNIKIFAFVFVSVILSFVISIAITLLAEKENANRGVMIQGMARSNYALFGIPLVTLLFPEGNIAIASILIAIVIPMYNILSVIVLTYFSSKTSNIKSMFVAILKNPLIIATFFGIVCLSFNVQFPYIIEQSIKNLSSIATPFSLFLLGASFEFNSIKEYKKQIILSVIGRLVIIPTIFLAAAVMLGFTGVELACVMVVFASPTAVSSFTMAKTMGSNSDLASSIVVFSSIFCIFSIFLYILCFKNMGLV